MKAHKYVLTPALAALALSACGGVPQGTSDGDSADRALIVASIYPLQYVAQEIAGDSAEVTSLAQQGSDTHDVELSPSQIASIGTADLVLTLEEFQPAVDDAVAQSGNDSVLAVNDAVELLEGGHAHEEEAAGEEGHDDHDHAHGAFDPHFWQDPQRMSKVADALSEKLTSQFPEHAKTYEANLERFTTEMDKLETEFAEGLAQCAIKEFITPHEAFRYLVEDSDLTEVSIVGLSSNEEPSPARIAEVQKVAKETGVTTIFFETLTSPAVTEAIAGDLGLKTAVLDPLENVTDKSPGDDYPSIMRANLQALRTANDCK